MDAGDEAGDSQGDAERRMKRIQEFTTEELFDELRSRHTCYIFLGHRKEDGDLPSHWFDWHGEDSICYGMCHALGFKIQNQMVNIEIHGEPGE